MHSLEIKFQQSVPMGVPVTPLGTLALEVYFGQALSPRIMVTHQGGTGENTGAQRAGSSLCASTSLRIGKDLRNLIQMGDVRRLIRAHWFRA